MQRRTKIVAILGPGTETPDAIEGLVKARAVMLSADTAAGAYPVVTVEAMQRIIMGTEKHPQAHRSKHRMDQVFHKIDESFAMSAMYATNHLHGEKAIIRMTESGDTPRLMSRICSHFPVFVFTRNPCTQRVPLFRCVKAIPFDNDAVPGEDVSRLDVEELLKRQVVNEGDHLLINKDNYANAQGGTSSLRVVRGGDVIRCMEQGASR